MQRWFSRGRLLLLLSLLLVQPGVALDLRGTGGTTAVSQGGTGATTLTGVVLGNGTSPMTATALSSGIAGALSDETGSGLAVFGTGPTLGSPIIGNIAPAANFTLTQNSVVPVTSVAAGALVNTLYLSAGRIGVGSTDTTLGNFQVGNGTTDVRIAAWSTGAYSFRARGGLTAGDFYFGATDAATPDAVFSNTAGTEVARLTNGGQLGVGVTPTSILHVRGTSPVAQIDNTGVGMGFVGVNNTELSLTFNRHPVTGAFPYAGLPHTGIYLFGAASNGSIDMYTSNSNGVLGTVSLGISSTGAVSMPKLAASSGATTGTMCWTTTTGNITINTTVACLASTRRIKQDIVPLDAGLATVMALRPVSYHLRPEFNPTHEGEQIGLIAEEVIEVEPRLATVDEEGLPSAVRYQQAVAVLVKAIQEQQGQIHALQQQINRLRERP